MSFIDSVRNVLSGTTTYEKNTSLDRVASTLSTNQEEKSRPEKGIFARYFEPAADQVRVRDVVREAFGIGEESDSQILKTLKGVGKFGVGVLQETARSGGSAGLTIFNTQERIKSKIEGRDARLVDQLDFKNGASDFERRFAEILFGEQPLESIGTRVGKAPTRATEFARQIGFEAQHIVNRVTAPVLVPAMIAMDLFPGAGKADDAFKALAKADNSTDVLKVLRTTIKNLPKGQEKKIANQLVDVTDPKKVQNIIEHALRTTEMRKLEATKQPLTRATVNNGLGVTVDVPDIPDDVVKDQILKAINDFDANTVLKKDGTIDLKVFDELDRLKELAAKGPLQEEEFIDAFRQFEKVGKNPLAELGINVGSFARKQDELAEFGVKKTRSLAKTFQESKNTVPEVAEKLQMNYNPMKNNSLVEEARKIINADEVEALRIVKEATEDYSALNNTLGQMLMGRLQKAGRFDEAIEIADILSEKAVKQGQAVQAFSIWNRLSPEGVLLKANKVLREANKLNSKVPKKLLPEQAQKLGDLAHKIEKMEDGVDKAEETAKLMSELANLVPPSVGRKIATIQTMAQLLNPKTFMRNVIGNGGFSAIENVKDFPAAALDSAVGLITGKRTKTFPSFGAQWKGVVVGGKQGYRDAILGIDTSGVPNRFELPRTPTFKGKVLGSAEKLLNISLRVPDRAMYKAAYDGSVYQQMKAHFKSTGELLKEPTQEMLEAAHHEGLYRTFQDDNMLSAGFAQLKRSLNKISGNEDFGLGDIIIKYPKTPANLLNRGFSYSPAGFVNSVYQMSRPLMGRSFNQKEFVESLSRASVGTAGLVGTGAILNQMGIITGKLSEDTDVRNVQRETGLNDYQVNVSALKRFVLSGMDAEAAGREEGDVLYTVDWFQPVIFPMIFGVNLNAGMTGAEPAKTSLFDALGSALDSVGEQSLIKNLTEATRAGGISETVKQTLRQVPASFIPTFVNQLSQLMDNTRRQVYNPNDVQYAYNLAANRVPGLDKTLQPQISAFGNELETYQSGSNNFFNVFFNPAFKSTYKPTPEAQLVLDLYEQEGLTTQAPRVKQFTQTVNGEKVTLSPTQIGALQQTVGTITRSQFHALSLDPNFLSLPAEDQAQYMQTLMTDVGKAAKIWVLGDRPTKKPNRQTMQILQQLGAGMYGDPTAGAARGEAINEEEVVQ